MAEDELFDLIANQEWDKLNQAIDKATYKQLFYKGRVCFDFILCFCNTAIFFADEIL